MLLLEKGEWNIVRTCRSAVYDVLCIITTSAFILNLSVLYRHSCTCKPILEHTSHRHRKMEMNGGTV